MRHGQDPLFQKKSLGQVFLTADWPVLRMAEKLKSLRAERVLEIGPGNGVLTRALLAQGFKVTAVEKDTRFAQRMQDYADSMPEAEKGSLEVFNEDILEFDWEAWLDSSTARPAIVGNIPYNISSPIVLRGAGLIQRMVGMLLMTQLEFARRVAARHDNKDYGSLSVFTQLRCDASIEFTVPRGCFHPVPKVDSAVMLCLPRRDVLSEKALKKTEQVTRTAFTQRRKKLRNSVRTFISEEKRTDKRTAEEIEKHSPIDLERRADSLSPAEFMTLAEYLLPD